MNDGQTFVLLSERNICFIYIIKQDMWTNCCIRKMLMDNLPICFNWVQCLITLMPFVANHFNSNKANSSTLKAGPLLWLQRFPDLSVHLAEIKSIWGTEWQGETGGEGEGDLRGGTTASSDIVNYRGVCCCRAWLIQFAWLHQSNKIKLQACVIRLHSWSALFLDVHAL